MSTTTNNQTAIIIATGFSMDRFTCGARDAIIGANTLKSGNAVLSEQVWAAVSGARHADVIVQMREAFASWLADQKPAVRSACAKWRTSSPLATRLSEGAKCVKFAHDNADKAAGLWACETLNAAMAFIRKDTKAAKDAGAQLQGDPDEHDGDNGADAVAVEDLSVGDFLEMIARYVKATPANLRKELLKSIAETARGASKA